MVVVQTERSAAAGAHLTEQELAEVCGLLERMAPVDPFEFRPLSSRLTLNVGKIAAAANRREIRVVRERRGRDQVMGLIADRYDSESDYPELSMDTPNLGAWRFLILCPVLIIRDGAGREYLLDGALRARLRGRISDAVDVFVISLVEATAVGAEGEIATAADSFEAFAKLPADSGWRAAYPKLAPQWFAPEAPGIVKARRDQEVLASYWFELFRTYFDNCIANTELISLSMSNQTQPQMAALYDNIRYFGRDIKLPYEFDTFYRKNMSVARRFVYKTDPSHALPPGKSSLFKAENNGIELAHGDDNISSQTTRFLYIIEIIWNQIDLYSKFCFAYKRKVSDPHGRKYRNPLPNFIEISAKREQAETARIRSAGGAPVNMADFVSVAAMSGVNPAKAFPQAQRMSTLLEWAASLHPDRALLMQAPDALMRIHFGFRCLVEQLGGDLLSDHWRLLFQVMKPERLTAVANACIEDLGRVFAIGATIDDAGQN